MKTSKKIYCEVTVRRPNGEIETIVHPRVDFMTPAIWSQMQAAMTAGRRGECLSYRNVTVVITTVTLSSRGWGDYSPCEWEGDISRPDAEILAECRRLLSTEQDVDDRDQTDAAILAKIAAARQELADAPAREERAVREAAAYEAKMAAMARVMRG